MAVRMPEVQLARPPRHVGWRKGHLDPGGDAQLVQIVDFVDGQPKPDSLVGGLLIAARTEGGFVRSTPAAALPVQAKEAPS